MKREQKKQPIIYSIYTDSIGFGYVTMSNSRELLDNGSIRVRPVCNRMIMERIKRSLDYFSPTVVFIQDLEGKTS